MCGIVFDNFVLHIFYIISYLLIDNGNKAFVDTRQLRRFRFTVFWHCETFLPKYLDVDQYFDILKILSQFF